MDPSVARVRVSGKFLHVGNEKWYAHGFCYGPFAPNADGDFFPDRERAAADFAQMRQLGATCFRTYFAPPEWVLGEALEHQLRVFVDVPWDKHRCFLEDWSAQQEARLAITNVARRLGNHPAVFAISVANEIPNDIVRFYGPRRVEAFLDELLDRVHQTAPECLATYANYPTTEFLQPKQRDFCCFNVYLHAAESFGRYLDRLQHHAGGAPLVVGEYGVDARQHGEVEQARRLADLATCVHRHGAAGGFVFSFTDDWYTGGHQIDQWAFGVTSRERNTKRAARSVRRVWQGVPETAFGSDLPKVTVVVCSYNGAATLHECLQSLMRLNYPDYEVLLIDDGSSDNTRDIAVQFPQVNYLWQANRGLSVARNVGLRRARGEIVAYTDSDCVADQDWLLYLVDAMRRQEVDGVGGPNLTPPNDNWIAQCVAASPGNPSHVMFDDRLAEHLPGCNMAFRRKALLAIGGFDAQFRQAGDDVDVCWRLLNAGCRLGYAAGAMVWHHRRCSVRAFWQQQKGYGRAEAMLAFKHPDRFLPSGHPRFDGVIYGDGKAGLPLLPATVYHGRFGSASYQTIYQPREFRFDARTTSLEWHCLSLLFLLLSTMAPWLSLVSVAMWLLTVRSVVATLRNADLPRRLPWTRRLLIAWLHLLQPVVRGLHRNGYTLRHKRLPQAVAARRGPAPAIRRISGTERELYWPTTNGRGRHDLLEAIVSEAQGEGWPGDYYGGWATWDLELIADLWHHVTIRTASEELGWPKRFTRARWQTRSTRVARALALVVAAWTGVAVLTGAYWALALGLSAALALLAALRHSRRRCLSAVGQLIARAADASQLTSTGPTIGKRREDHRETSRNAKYKATKTNGTYSAGSAATAGFGMDYTPASDPTPP